MTPLFRTVPQARDLTGFSSRHLRRLARLGVLPVYHIGRSVRYREDDLIKLFVRKEVPTKRQALRVVK
jgi:hypothetical protein